VSEHQAEPLPERGEGGRFLPRTEGPQRTAERERLAQAIERRRAAVEERDRTAAAIERAVTRRLDTANTRRRAEAELATAKAAEGRWLANAMLVDDVPSVSPVKAAEAKLADIEGQHVALTAAEATLREQLVQAEHEFEWAV
jgi:hypothetical protein